MKQTLRSLVVLTGIALLGNLLDISLAVADDEMIEMFGIWGAVTMNGNFHFLSPDFASLRWQVMNQTRLRDDSSQGTRFSENLLFSQIGYAVNPHWSFWLGYTNDWIRPLHKPGFNESRPYQDLLWQQDFEPWRVMVRTRLEERIRQDSGDLGVRLRQLAQISHAVPILDGLSVYLGDEMLFYLNQNVFGKQGLAENRVFSGFSYQINPTLGFDLGYIGQLIKSHQDIMTHNLQFNLRYTL